MPDADATTDRPRKRKWLRRVRMIVSCVIAGAIINVLVAWGCANIRPPTLAPDGSGHVRYGNFQNDWWFRKSRYGNASFEILRSWTREYDRQSSPDTGEKLSVWNPLNRPTNEFAEVVIESESGSVDERRIIQASGWPWCSMYWDSYRVVTDTGINIQGGGGRWNLNWLQHPLPLRPLMPGFILGMLMYAISIWAPAAGYLTAKRWLRASRGRCSSCCYDLRGANHVACPECGEPISKIARRAAAKNAMIDRPCARRWPQKLHAMMFCLAAGAMINILVAYASLFVAQYLPSSWIDSRADRGIAVKSAPGWASFLSNGIELEAKREILRNWSRVDQLIGPEPPSLTYLLEVECGMPFRTANGSAKGESFNPILWTNRIGLVFDDPIDGPAYPFRPMWFGLIANTFIYAVSVCTFGRVTLAIIRRRHRRPLLADEPTGDAIPRREITGTGSVRS